MSHAHHHTPEDDHLQAHKSKITEAAVRRMQKPAWLQRQEAIELAERERTRRDPYPTPDDGDDASMRGLV